MSGSIDLHAHYLAPAYRDALAEAQIWMIGGLPVPEWSPELALAFMDAHDIETQVLSVSDPGVEFLSPAAATTLARACNEYAAELVAAHPGRFAALALLPLHDGEAAAAEAVRSLDELGLAGVGLLSSADGRYPGDDAFAPLLHALDARGAWAFVHPTAPAQRPSYSIPDSVTEYPFDTTRAIASLLFNGAFARHRSIRWHFAHGGGTLPMHRLRLASLAANAREFGTVLGLPPGAAQLDAGSVQEAIARSVFDTALVADPASLEAVKLLGGGVVFGSDFPFAARLYGETGELQGEIEEVFGAEQAPSVRRSAAARRLATHSSSPAA